VALEGLAREESLVAGQFSGDLLEHFCRAIVLPVHNEVRRRLAGRLAGDAKQARRIGAAEYTPAALELEGFVEDETLMQWGVNGQPLPCILFQDPPRRL